MSKYILIEQKDHVTMTTLFTPTIDLDLRAQPLVPRDPRKLEQVRMIAVVVVMMRILVIMVMITAVHHSRMEGGGDYN